MHGGKCQDFGSGLNCSCSDEYAGIGCQYEYDACQANACKNGATCTNDVHGFKCICPPGYTGKYCDEDIVDCKENSCPPSATCIDLTERFYCQCPFNLTGEDCRKSKFKSKHQQTASITTLCIIFSNFRGLRLILYGCSSQFCISSYTFLHWSKI